MPRGDHDIFTAVTCGLIAYGPSLFCYIFFLRKRASLFLISIASAFFMMVALALQAGVFKASSSSEDWGIHVLVGVIIQELFRYLFWRAIERVKLQYFASHLPNEKYLTSDEGVALASGIGFGFMYAAIMYSTLLFHSYGYESLFTDNCTYVSLFSSSAIVTMAFSIIHTIISYVLYFGYSCGNWRCIISGWMLHIVAAFATLLSQMDKGCYYMMAIELVVAFVAIMMFRNIQTCMSARRAIESS